MSNVVIVDNSPHVFAYQLDNGIPIESWYDNEKDEELLKLIPFLESLLDVEDVRPKVRERFELFRRIEDIRNSNEFKAYQMLENVALEEEDYNKT